MSIGRFAIQAVTTMLFCVAACLPSIAIAAPKFPDGPVRIIVPSTPGGTLDFLARVIGAKLALMWGQSVIVDDHPGAGGIVGSQLLVQSPPDGRTLLFVSTGYTINPAIYAKLPYDTARDFVPITSLTRTAEVLVANPKLQVNSVPELLAVARANPGKLTYASAGMGTGGWICGELLRQMAGIDLVEVPYKGAGAATTAIVGGETDLQFTDAGPALPFVTSGKLKVLAVSTLKRLPQLPNAPTLDESGVKGFQVDASAGALAPAGTPRAIIDQLQHDIYVAVHSRDVADKLTAQGYIAVASTPAEYAAQIKGELQKWADLVKKAKIKAIGM